MRCKTCFTFDGVEDTFVLHSPPYKSCIFFFVFREEEVRVQEEARIREEEKARAEAKQQEEARKGKAANTNKYVEFYSQPDILHNNCIISMPL